MKLGEVIQRVQSLYSRGLQSKDTRLSRRHIYSTVSSVRSLLLQQQYNKNQKISQWAYQPLPCVELVQAQLHECACVPEKGCTILRSKHKLPQPVTGIDKHLIQSVTSIDGITESYDEVTLTSSKYNKGHKFTPNRPSYYIHNGYIFITLKRMTKAVAVVILSGDVIEAHFFPSLCECSECECEDYTSIDFPIDSDLETTLIELASSELILKFKQGKNDPNSNSVDDTNTGMTHNNG